MTDIEKIRLKIGTVISDTYTDDQIQAFLDMEESVNSAAASAIESWAAGQTATIESEHIGDYSYSKRMVANALMIANRLRALDDTAPVVDYGSFNLTGITEEAE